MTEEEVAEAATAAAQEAANNSYVLQSATQHGNDAQSRYYALAHRYFFACQLRSAWRCPVLQNDTANISSREAQLQEQGHKIPLL